MIVAMRRSEQKARRVQRIVAIDDDRRRIR